MRSIINNRIAGTRITVWDVYHYLESGHWSLREIADILSLSEEQVKGAVQYIEANKEEVLKVHREIEERNARGNSPEIEAKLQKTRAKMRAWLDARLANDGERNGARHSSGR